MYDILLMNTDEAMAGRAWLILMILISAVVHAYAKRNQLIGNDEVENFDILQLVDIITGELQLQRNAEIDAEGRKEVQDIIDSLIITRKSRNQLCHNRKFKDLIKYTNWTVAWIKVASALLNDTSTYSRSQQEKGQDIRRINQLTAACRALLQPGKKTIPIKEAFRFALGSGSYAKAARAYFIQVTIVQCALEHCASIYAHKKGQEKKKDIKELLNFIMDPKLSCFLNGKDRNLFENLFFGDDGIKDTRNLLAHNTECSTRHESKYNDIACLWKELLLQLDFTINDHYSEAYISMLDEYVQFLLDIDQC